MLLVRFAEHRQIKFEDFLDSVFTIIVAELDFASVGKQLKLFTRPVRAEVDNLHESLHRIVEVLCHLLPNPVAFRLVPARCCVLTNVGLLYIGGRGLQRLQL